MSKLSPSSSPRLPSPPPIAEDQINPKSPTVSATENQTSFLYSSGQSSTRRVRPGTKSEDISDGPPLVDLAEVGFKASISLMNRQSYKEVGYRSILLSN